MRHQGLGAGTLELSSRLTHDALGRECGLLRSCRGLHLAHLFQAGDELSLQRYVAGYAIDHQPHGLRLLAAGVGMAHQPKRHPAPFGPSSPNTSPSSTAKSIPLTASKSPYFFFSPSTSRIAGTGLLLVIDSKA